MKTINILVFSFLITFSGIAQKYTNTQNSNVSKEWNGATFASSITFVNNIKKSAEFSLLEKALESEETLKALEAEEMVTIFAITNQGFEQYYEKQDSIFGNDNAEKLSSIIKYHTIPGRIDSHSINKAISKNGGIAYFATLQGEKLGIKLENKQLMLVDSKGNTAIISATDYYHKNGFFHIVDGVVFPNN